MTKKLIKEWIEACDTLIENYKEYKVIPCPLCKIPRAWCDECLWVIFEKKYCGANDGVELKYTDRIKRLRRWKRRLNKMLKEK